MAIFEGEARVTLSIEQPGASAAADIPPGADRSQRDLRSGVAFGMVIIAVLSALAVWFGHQGYAAEQDRHQRAAFLSAGQDAALLLTTVDVADVDGAVTEITAASTGRFLDGFRDQTQSFVDTVRRAKSTTEGKIVEAGLETVVGDRAAVLVAVTVTTTLDGVPTPPRLWRMRIGLQRNGSEVKVADVEFVP
ncbi:mammalian cell entry protein [Mycolicibacterium sp.]|uniref:mammalian cell entry protein n=1 Tax=Mycolicibacterium sp. TaxID=2320850 RepID=UPI003D1121A5